MLSEFTSATRNIVRDGIAYQKKTEDEYAEQHRERQEKNLHRRAKELGDELTKLDAPPPEEAPPLSA